MCGLFYEIKRDVAVIVRGGVVTLGLKLKYLIKKTNYDGKLDKVEVRVIFCKSSAKAKP